MQDKWLAGMIDEFMTAWQENRGEQEIYEAFSDILTRSLQEKEYQMRETFNTINLQLVKADEQARDWHQIADERSAALNEAISLLQESHKWLDFFADPKSRPKELQQMTIGECNRWIEAAVLSARAFLEKVKAS